MSEPRPLDAIAQDYARSVALIIRAAFAGESSVKVPSLGGIEDIEDIEDIDLFRATIHAVAETIGGTDPDAWGQTLVLLLSVCGDRFLEVCDGGL